MNSTTELFLPFVLGFIMFSLGLSLTWRDFAQVLENRRGFIVGAFGQVVMLPLLALAIILALSPPPAVGLGLLVLSVCPGGVTSAFMTSMLRGNYALSISMTACFSLLSVVSVPLVLGLLSPLVAPGVEGMRLPVASTIQTMLGVTVMPVLLGMGARTYRPVLASRLERPIRVAATILFFFLFVGLIVAQRDDFVPFMRAAGLFTVLLNVATIGAAILLASAARLESPDGVAIMFECGIQNAPLAMFIAVNLLSRPDLAIAPGTYGVLQAPLTLLLAFGVASLGYNKQEREAVRSSDQKDPVRA